MAPIILAKAVSSIRPTTLSPVVRLNNLPRYQKTRYSTSKDGPSSKTPPTPPHNGNPSFGAANWKELGGSRTVKIVVITALTIAGTVETIFWTKVLWAKFGPAKVVDGGSEEGK
jgi:hypothetical protein